MEPNDSNAAPSVNVLLVDDNPVNLLALEAVLEPLGQNLIRANSGQEALNWLLDHDDCAVILLDVQMPILDGFETAGLIKEREKSRHIPIIFVTATSNEERFVLQGYAAGTVDYIVKPFGAEALKAKVAVFVELFQKAEELKRQISAKHKEERQFIEAEAHLSEFKSTLDATLDGVFMIDAHTLHFSYINHGGIGQLGYEREEILTLTPFDVLPEADATLLSEKLNELRDGTLQSFTFQTQQKGKDGSTVPVELFMQFVAPERGAGRFVAVARDITERKEVEEALRKNETKFRTIFETALDAILLANDDGLYVDANPAACALLGVEHEQLMGRSIADFVSPVTQDAVRAAWKDFLREGQQEGEFEFQQPSGTLRQAEYRAVAGLQPGIHMAVMRDITERKQAEAEEVHLHDQIVAHRQRLNTIVANMPGVVWESWSESDASQQRVDFVSDYVETMLGYSVEEWLATSNFWLTIVHPDDKERVESESAAIFASGRGTSQFRWMTKDGSVIWGESHMRIICDEEGHSVGLRGVTLDITESKGAKEALEARSREIVTIWESMSDAFYSLDTQWRFTHVNSQAGQMLRRNQAELIGKYIWDEFSDAIGSLIHQEYERAMQQQIKVEFEEFYVPLNTWFEIHAYPSTAGLSVYFRDITERKLDEAALRRSEERYRSLTLATAQIVWTTSADGMMEDMPAWRDFTGQSLEEVKGRGWTQALHPSDRERIEATIAGCLEIGTYEDEYRVRAANGDYRLFAVRGVPIREEDGSVREWVGTFTDIHDHRQAEEQRDRFFTLSLEMLAIAGFDGYFKRVNPAFLETLGWTEAEFLSTPFLELSHPDDEASTQVAVEKLAQGNTIVGFENRYRTKQGGWRWLEWKSVAVPEDGLIYAAARDVTERKETEAQLLRLHDELEVRVEERTAELGHAIESLRVENIQHQMTMATLREVGEALQITKEEADSANLAKSEFLSRMSHELRTPLNAILGFGQILDRQELSALQKESIGYILKGGRHLLGLINEVLDVARVEAGHVDLSIEPVALHEVVPEVCALVRPLAEERHIRLEENSASLGRIYILADLQRFKQVLINILSNAIKYNRDAGHVEVRCTVGPDDWVSIAVRDTGFGISPQDLPKLFIPFERLGAATSGIEGTGLGLVLSQRLAIAMGGTLEVESILGQGTTFTLKLPQTAAPEEQATNVPKDSDLAPVNDNVEHVYCVLCIEDNPSNLRLIEAIMESRPKITLLSAMQGSIGLDLARQHEPDLILLDLDLPDIKGNEVLTRLQQSALTRDIPVVIVSADATPSQIEKLLSAGAKAYLTKPLDVGQFLLTLDQFLVLPSDKEIH